MTTADPRPSSPDRRGGVGVVWLVGAGPGDPGLITVAGLERLRQADVVVYDRLVSPDLLKAARPDAELIYVGKLPSSVGQGPGSDLHDQDAINRLLIARAKEGKTVLRLKGGDPFVFGRGGEESQALRAAAVPFQVVPGVTSATAVPAYAGIPVTHRGLASSFAVITGHEDPAKDESSLNWQALATAVDTLVLLMGARTLGDIARTLIEHGRPPDTPAAVIQWGTTPQQRTVVATLAGIAQRADEAGLSPPTVAVIGDVVRLRETLAWYESRPLFGLRVLITRTRRQAGALSRLLALEGALPIELPAIEIQPSGDPERSAEAIQRLASGSYQWTVFTSANAVALFFEALWGEGRDARAFATAKVCAIGPATAEALAEQGLVADLVPAEYISEGIIETLRGVGLHGHAPLHPGDRILLPRAEGARPELVEGLRALGAQVDEVVLYRAAVPETAPAEALALLRDGAIDVVAFTSSSTVRNLAALLGDDFRVILSGEDAGAGNVVSSRRSLGMGKQSPVDDRQPLSRARERGLREAEGVRLARRPLIACIGPVTARAVEEVLGRRPDVVASEYTVPGLVRAIREGLL